MSDVLAALPEPLTPPNCDLGRNDWFPLYFDRLRKSKWWRRASDLARARNVMLWGEAYKMVPAGSMPDDDDELAEAAGFGMDVESFLIVKAEIMACWTMCSDGRWYHPTVCEQAMEAWEKVSEKRQAARAKKAAQRAAIAAKMTRVPENKRHVPRDSVDVPDDRPNVPQDDAEGQGGHPTQDRTGQDRRLEAPLPVAPASPSAAARAPSKPRNSTPWIEDSEFCAVWAAAPTLMRRRGSQQQGWEQWTRELRSTPASVISAGFIRYLKGDPDVARTGGPGLHRWLKLKTWQRWTGDDGGQAGADWPDSKWAVAVRIHATEGKWPAEIGPKPGEQGCRAPPHLLGVGTACEHRGELI
jgi:hypothetical protein